MPSKDYLKVLDISYAIKAWQRLERSDALTIADIKAILDRKD
jgi:hypothetical protein